MSTTPGRRTRPAPPGGAGDPMAVLSRRIVVLTAGWLLGCAAVGWFLTARHAVAMSGVASGLGQLGTGMPARAAAPVFLATWVAMMAAMMFPAAVPMVAVHHALVRQWGGRAGSTAAFAAGYLLTWSLVGILALAALAALAALVGLGRVPAAAGQSRWLSAAAGLLLAGAGVYQFSRWKWVCLRNCRSPLAFLIRHRVGAGSRSALRGGLLHGAYCLGCCWALMTVLVVVGLMNLIWMVGLSLVFLLEKGWRHGAWVSRVVGAGLVLLGMAVAVQPELLPLIAGGGGSGPGGMSSGVIVRPGL